MSRLRPVPDPPPPGEPFRRDDIRRLFGAMTDCGHDHGRMWIQLDLVALANLTGADITLMADEAGKALLRLPT